MLLLLGEGEEETTEWLRLLFSIPGLTLGGGGGGGDRLLLEEDGGGGGGFRFNPPGGGGGAMRVRWKTSNIVFAIF